MAKEKRYTYQIIQQLYYGINLGINLVDLECSLHGAELLIMVLMSVPNHIKNRIKSLKSSLISHDKLKIT